MKNREVLAASSTVFLVLIAVGLLLDKSPTYVLLLSLLCALAVVGFAGLARILKPLGARRGPNLTPDSGGGPPASDVRTRA